MLTFKNVRFWLGETSFALPEGSLIDPESPVVPFCGFVIYPPDMSCRIECYFFPEDGSAEEGMKKDLSSVSRKTEIEPVRYPCGNGWETFYRTCRHECYDLRFDIPPVEGKDGEMLNTLNIQVYAEAGTNIRDVIQGAFFRELINSVQM